MGMAATSPVLEAVSTSGGETQAAVAMSGMGAMALAAAAWLLLLLHFACPIHLLLLCHARGRRDGHPESGSKGCFQGLGS
jgi:hypothetical protein